MNLSIRKGPDDIGPGPIPGRSPRPFPRPSWERPPTNAPVTRGSVLATNSPGGVPIKPLPWEIVAADRIGAVEGWTSLAAAERELATLTQGGAGAAAIVRDGGRLVGYMLDGSGLGFDDRFQRVVAVNHPLTGRGGLFWRNDALVAVVDGSFVERFDA